MNIYIFLHEKHMFLSSISFENLYFSKVDSGTNSTRVRDWLMDTDPSHRVPIGFNKRQN